ncbi:MAG TPA: class I SAM-dependent methyltransferase [Blastocatellia bacterium]|nr:class I SAM-dependent methyltransferase [Blastocatellia bacterium]
MTVTRDIKAEVREFWEAHPCGAKFVSSEIGSPQFFRAVSQHRYETEWHIPQVVKFETWRGRSVLEVGCGLGTDAVRFAQAGAHYTGIDLTRRAVDLTRSRFETEGLRGEFRVADAEQLPFEAERFDLFYSHGVLHHTPDMASAIAEAHRVLKPGGTAMVMLYNRYSYNYYINIMAIRRLGARMLRFDWGPRMIHRLTGESIERLEEFQEMYRRDRLQLLDRGTFLNNNTDGVGNPLARVYTRREARRIFHDFTSVRTEVHFLNKRWIPLVGRFLPRGFESALASVAGWHLWIIARKV